MHKTIFLCLLLLLVFPVAAQIDVDEDIQMVSFVSAPLNVQGLRPETWMPQANAEGVFLRSADPFDLTGIIMQALDSDKATFLTSIANSFALESELESLESIESNFFVWDIYQFDRTQGASELLVDLAVAEDSDNGRVYYILMQTNAAFYDSLHEQVFLPAVEWLSPIQIYEDKDGLFFIPIPTRWDVLELENYVQLSAADGNIGIFVRAIESDDPIVAAQEFLALINPDFDTSFDGLSNNLQIISDPARIGDIDVVYIIDWLDGINEDRFVLQSVARVYDGVIYITVIASTIDLIAAYEHDIIIIDNGFGINALLEIAEATAEPQE